MLPFITDILAKFGILISERPPDIGQNSDRGISDFQISGQSLTKVNCHNFRTSDDINVKLGPVTKPDKRNKTTSRQLDEASRQQILTLLLYFKFMANLEQSRSRIPEASSVKLTFSLTVTFYLTKTNVSNTALTLLPKSCFLEKNVDISKIKRTLVLKVIFSRTTCVYLRIKFQVSSLTIFRKECRRRGV